jgi:hypothetical protein
MAWIKRNLYFFIGSLVALALIGVGGWYFYVQYSAEAKSATDIAEAYDNLKKLTGQKLGPGAKGGKVDNIEAAQEQQKQVQDWIASIRPHFQSAQPIGSLENFPTELDDTVVQLQRQAANDGVSVAKDYYFTFQAQKNMLAIPQNVLPELAVRLAEIKAICGILFDSKIGALENIRREALFDGDTNGPDYLPPDQRTVSTNGADVTPYEVTFRCFSGELASVMGGLAASPYCLIVKSLDVEPDAAGMAATEMHTAYGQQFQGVGRFRPAGQPDASAMPLAPPRGSRPATFLNEHPLRVTMLIDVVKPRTAK